MTITDGSINRNSMYSNDEYNNLDFISISDFEDSLLKIDPVSIYLVKENDIGRNDYLGLNTLGKESLWWVILMYNKVQRIQSLYIGQPLKIPNINSTFKLISESILR